MNAVAVMLKCFCGETQNVLSERVGDIKIEDTRLFITLALGKNVETRLAQ